MSKENKKIKYPKSITNIQCQGPCYEKNTSILHPTRFRTVTSHESFCPTTEHMGQDPVTGDPIKLYTDGCVNPTHNKDELTFSSLLAPKSEFSKLMFLAIYYEINSFEDCMVWLEGNSHVGLKTQIRVVNASLNVFGNELLLIDDRFVNFFIDYVKKSEIYRIYDNVHKNIGIVKEQVLIIDEKNNTLKKDDNQIERMNYILLKFVNTGNVKSFLIKYANAYKGWNDIDDNLELIVKSFIEYIIKKILII